MTRYRTNTPDHLSAADAAAVAKAKTEVVIRFDESVAFERFQLFGTADRIVLGTGYDESTPVAHTYFFELNNGEFAFNTPRLVIDARELSGLVVPEQNLYGEVAYVGTQTVTAYNVLYLGGDGSDRFNSGMGSDTARLGGGDDYYNVGTGVDSIYGGAGDDYVDSLQGDFNFRDTYHGGAGTDQLTFYNQNLTDADFVNMRSVEILGPSGPSNLELDANADRAGIRELFVDSFSAHVITVGAGFTGPLLINHLGAAGNVLNLDASASSATITLYAGYDSTRFAPTYIGGSGSEDTISISNGYIYPGSPAHGGDLTNVKGFEHVLVEDLGGDSGAYLVLATQQGDIDAAFQSVDATGLGETKPFHLRAADSRMALHVESGDGADRLFTGGGRDQIEGGGGADLIRTGGGRDVLLYTAVTDSSGDAIDTVKQFASGKDKVDVTGLGGSLSGATIAFFGNQDGGSGDDAAFAGTAGNGVLDAVFRSDTHSLWFDTDDNGLLDPNDLHIVLAEVSGLTGADVMAGHVVI